MTNPPKKVLILDGGAAHAMAIAECLKNSGYQVAVLCNNINEYGYHTKFADERYLGMNSHKKGYAEWVLHFLKSHHYDVLIPTSDNTARFMSLHKPELKNLTGVLMPNWEIFNRGYNKNELMKVCKSHGFPHPQSIDIAEIIEKCGSLESEELQNFSYPGLLKPNLTSGGRGMVFINNFEDLKKKYTSIHNQYGECHLQRYIREGGRQIKVQIMTDNKGEVAYSSVIWKQRYYPINGGSSCCNVTIDNPEIVGVCDNVLKSIGWIGFADFDLIEDPDTRELLIMELNPRLPACVRSAFKSGMDYATMIADMTLGMPLRKYEYNPGKRLRHLGFDILWFLKSPNRFSTNPSWFRFCGNDLYYQDWIMGDFSAFFWGTWGNIKKQMNPEFRKAKAGMDF